MPVAVTAVLTTSPVSAASPTWTRIASGLHNPRGVDVGPDGNVYVVEAGVGAGTTDPAVGYTGEISKIQYPRSSNPRVWSVQTGLLSFGNQNGGDTAGPDGISVDESGRIFTIITGSAMLTNVSDPQIGQLLRVNGDGTWSAIANVGDRDYKWTQHHITWANDFPDADPYGVLVTHGHKYVVDAGSNTLDRVKSDGRVQIVAFFPNGAAADSTPTCVTEGPDGALYVGTLSLVDSLFAGPPHPAANVWRVDPSQLNPRSETSVQNVAQVWASGFWPITGCNFDNHGNLWVSEIATGVGGAGPTGGALVKVPWAYPTDSSYRGEGRASKASRRRRRGRPGQRLHRQQEHVRCHGICRFHPAAPGWAGGLTGRFTFVSTAVGAASATIRPCRGIRGGSGAWSTRSTRARSRTATATASATCAASSIGSTTSSGWASTRSGSRPSFRRRWPTSATTSPTTRTSTRSSAASPTWTS